MLLYSTYPEGYPLDAIQAQVIAEFCGGRAGSPRPPAPPAGAAEPENPGADERTR